MRVWHATMAALGRNPLLDGEANYRKAVGILGRVAGPMLLLFSIVDEHIHLSLAFERPKVSRIITGISLALRPILITRLEPTHVIPVLNRAHMERLVPYLLRQPVRHKLPCHPAIWAGSAFLDSSGCRIVEGISLPINSILPRFHIQSAYEAVGLQSDCLQPYDDRRILSAGASRLMAAASSAMGADPELAEIPAPW